jgi:hypothetical protein
MARQSSRSNAYAPLYSVPVGDADELPARAEPEPPAAVSAVAGHFPELAPTPSAVGLLYDPGPVDPAYRRERGQRRRGAS